VLPNKLNLIVVRLRLREHQQQQWCMSRVQQQKAQQALPVAANKLSLIVVKSKVHLQQGRRCM
jgi:hypothetical protein